MTTKVVGSIRADWIFHLAAHGAYSSQTDLQEIFRTNVTGTINLVEACLKTGFEALVNAGSSSEYGFKDHAPAENESIEPNSYYAVTKASATLFCRYTAQRYRVHMPTLRLYSVYGPYEEPTRLMPTLIVRALDEQLPSLVNANTARDYVYVEDVTDAFLLAAAKSDAEFGAVYNVGSGVQTSLNEVVAIARRMLNVAAEPVWETMPSRQWDTSIWVADNTKARRSLNWQPRYTVEQGLQETTDWFIQHQDMLDRYRAELNAAAKFASTSLDG